MSSLPFCSFTAAYSLSMSGNIETSLWTLVTFLPIWLTAFFSFAWPASGYEHVGTFIDKPFCCCEPAPTASSGDHAHLSRELLRHIPLPPGRVAATVLQMASCDAKSRTSTKYQRCRTSG